MQQIQIDDQVFKAAQQRAADAGYAYVADVLVHDLVEECNGETPNLDHLFTPERLALIDNAAADIDAGNFFTAEQVWKHFKQKRAEWIQKNSPR